MAKKIVLFEDTPHYARDVYEALQAGVAGLDGEIVLIKGDSFPPLDRMTLEDALYDVLDSKQAFFCIADRDLTTLSLGLSEDAVARACQASAVPECRYARIRREKPRERLMRLVRDSSPFTLDTDITDLARFVPQVVDIYSGFARLFDTFKGMQQATLTRSTHAGLLTAALGKPAYESYALLYEPPRIPNYREMLLEDMAIERLARLRSYVIGYWLKQRILEFPGLLLSAGAAAAYLDLSRDAFLDPRVNAAFESARYTGPFAGSGPFWWRPGIDTLLMEKTQSGFEIARAALGPDPDHSLCSECHEADARYYCIVTEKPVCAAHSVGGFPWMPNGADLARISKELWEREEPWLNL